MRMVEESKNERLTMLLGKTNELLVRLGAAVQRQKDAEHDGIEPLTVLNPELSATESGTPEEEADVADIESDRRVKTGDLLEGQRQYNSVIHSIQEKVMKSWLDTSHDFGLESFWLLQCEITIVCIALIGY